MGPEGRCPCLPSLLREDNRNSSNNDNKKSKEKEREKKKHERMLRHIGKNATRDLFGVQDVQSHGFRNT
jgi:hypothetical protein